MFPLLLLLSPPIASSLIKSPIVTTSYGAVRGYEYEAQNGFVAEIFKKIPFAAPPTGMRRWKKPEPPEPWNYTVDGTFFGPACAQVPSNWKGISTGFSEDCLLMHIYTSKECRESTAACPVVVYIHGGSALFGGVLEFPDETLVTNYPRQGVILVTFAYRLGVFGVMALGDENVLPANLAMHDIVEALRFVRQEIHAFGGNKDEVTLMGHSTGSTIVLAMVFSPAFNKVGEIPYFTRAIGMSSSMLLESEDAQVNRSHGFAKHLGCTGSAREIIDCLWPLSTAEIINAAATVGGAGAFSDTHLVGITVAGELMPILNMNDLRQNQQAHMAGLANTPTKLIIGTVLNELNVWRELENSNGKTNEVHDVLGVLNSEECMEKYNSDLNEGKFNSSWDTLSQVIFVTTSLFAATQARTGAEVYLYQLDYPKHAQHTDDLYYMMGVHDYPMDENEEWLSRVYPLYFTNFIRGLPLAPDWTPLDPDRMNYYSINKSFTDGVVPRMKMGYHQYLTDYYAGMMKYDEELTILKEKVLNAPIEYKNLTLFSDHEPFNLRDLLFWATVIGIVLFIVFKLYEWIRGRQRRAEETSLLDR